MISTKLSRPSSRQAFDDGQSQFVSEKGHLTFSRVCDDSASDHWVCCCLLSGTCTAEPFGKYTFIGSAPAVRKRRTL